MGALTHPPGDPLAGARRSALAVLRPPPRIPLSTWIEQNVRLPSDASSLPGPVRLWRYQREICDEISNPENSRVVLVKSVRIGLTMILTGALGALVANDPSPVLCVLPTESDCRTYVVSVLEPMFQASPVLRGALSDNSAVEDRSTLLSRRYPGGSLKVIAARSPRNLRAHTARCAFLDEADSYAPTDEGDVIALAENRLMSFSNALMVIGSTPVHTETSNVLKAYAASDQRVFEVPCPSCQVRSVIAWANIEWPEGQPERAAWRCPACRELIEERHKPAMVDAGIWTKTAPEVRGIAGFRINSLISPYPDASWGRLAEKWIKANADGPQSLQVFINCQLAEGWDGTGDEIDDTELNSRVEPFGLDRIPVECVQITCGCDVQDDRIETTILGWTEKGDALVLAHVVIWGEVTSDSLWAELDALLKSSWKHPLGGQLRIDAAAVDSGSGGHYDRVMSFCAARLSRRVVATKGVSGIRPAIEASKTSVVTRGQRLFLIGVDNVKSNVLGRIRRGNTIRFSDSLGPDYFEQLASERQVTRYTRGTPVIRFEPIPGRRNEALDCICLAFAVRGLAPLILHDRMAELALDPNRKPPPTVIRSRWLDQRRT